MECQQATPAAPVASAPTRRASAAAGQADAPQQVSEAQGGRPVARGRWTDPLAGVLASVVARRSSDAAAGPVLARKTTIRDDPADHSRGIHAEFVGTPKEQINPHIHYGPLLNDCATSMVGWLFPDLDFEGSGPKAGTWPWWWTGANAPDNTDYWVRGHLLNENLGGPGEPRNLTPITKQCNSRHHSLVEALCKHAFGQGQLVVYTVVPRYDGVGPPLAAIAKNPHHSVWSYLATHLDCDWSFVDGNANPKGHGTQAIANTH
jgi:hypothetical protein